jgi:predicted ATPase/DNA-binding CsgD family transcriptional regulator
MSPLPVDLSTFVGRDPELAELKPLLLGARLLTLVGAGGAGKTRLALEVGRRHEPSFADGVCLVDLAGLPGPWLVAQAVSSALEVKEQARRPLLATLSDHLRGKRLLLVLDNCEHLLAECAAVVDALLRVCPGLVVLATSRTRLGITGEVTYRVPSLPEADAVRLFLDRACAANPAFRLTDENRPAVQQICRRLDGIPLAIELAAVRLHVLSAAQIAARLDDRFRLLVGGSRTALPRQQTLRATLDWSFDLLAEAEQVAWRQLAIFASDFDLDAAEAVIDPPGADRDDVLDLIERLAEQSIVSVHEEHTKARYRLLETIRQYGLEKLRDVGEADAVRGRYVTWFLARAERAESEWRGPNQVEWLVKMGRELDNIRAALEWATTDRSRAQIGLRMATGLWLFWQVRGQHTEGRMWLSAFLALTDEPSTLRAKALNVSGFLAYGQGETAIAMQLLEKSLAMYRQLGDEGGVALSLLRLGIGAYYHGDLPRAVAVLEESLARYRGVSDPVGTHVALYELAEALSYTGDFARSRRLHEEGLALKRQLGDRWHIAFSLFGLGLLAFMEGEYARAAALQQESLMLRRELDDRWGIAMCLEVFAWIRASQGRVEHAARLLGAAEAARSTMSASLIAPHARNHDDCLTKEQAALGAQGFDRAWQVGKTLSAEEAFQLAAEPPDPAGAIRRPRGLLTKREVQIARLVASGLTNREIGTKLFIAERTADAHVEHILNKLGFHSRLEIARWVDAQHDPDQK